VSFLLVPHQATSTSATIWVAAVAAARPSLQLQVGERQPAALKQDDWAVLQSRGRDAFWSQRVTVDGLAPGTRYPARLLEGGLERASGTAVTLPETLPTIDEAPFICLLGSCFAHLTDQAGAAGAAYAALPAGARPSLKFLSGDQVYLDAPFPKYLYNLFGDDDLQAELLATYITTWTQQGDGRGFGELLRVGATYFSSDDHEIWNNAPSPTPIVRATWWPFGDRGAAWLRIAGGLYDTFQTSSRSHSFKVGRLSFRILDIRLGRTSDRSRFMDAAEVASLADWVARLDGPGVLVCGQPIFVPTTGMKGHLTDWGLADFGQYADIVRILLGSEHDLLLLTGDVHYGRVAGCRLPSGASLIEIIASPFALIDKRFGGTWYAPPELFPAAAIPGAPQSPIWVAMNHQLAEPHFATLEFAADGPRVRLSVRAWPIPAPGRAPTSTFVFRQLLD
jgi:hypothetical protein